MGRSPVLDEAAERARLAAEALAQAQADARTRGEPAPGPPGQTAAQAEGGAPRPHGAPRSRRDDPQPLRSAIAGLLDEQGWQTAAAVGSVFGRWHQIVGPELAAHTRPGGFADGELEVIADSTAWATQVRLLVTTLLNRLNAELGAGAVTKVRVRGPTGPRRSGPWRVRGGRGPRDDYG